ncbi:Sec-independent protein translocase TatCD [Planococcus antarcticus DSM 14505]|uniref:Sec-independent protein translocase protein TatC n=1 Tax=Planococcus antarcticus DSM 14505 TaxID=1185653 RepID=A0A1C7DBV8_9BACL|nr:twin-arginine translocase subunit TatC [Planococcus antarcticus]ANU08989.1 twin arginine-targeting protein translocase TatC [Planococcus antarcticus DSM 14505]EIM07239.1 Sec-independent protein translocase TatCD [Planococcus antarcticus DSM 14505]
MDPYGDKNLTSPLRKKAVQPEKPAEKALEKMPEPPIKEPKPPVEEPTMKVDTLVDHLGELRKQLIKSAIVFLFFLLVVFSTLNFWFPYIVKGNDLVILGPLEVIKFYTSISATLALGLSLPFLIHFIWQFVKPGLEEREARFLGLYSPVMLVLFILGLAFGYFVVNPLSFQFLIGLGMANFDVMISANEYIHFLIMTTVPLGLLFEMPIIALFLSSIGVLTSVSMKKVRKWSYLVLAIVSALITPPDFLSQLLVLIPMAGLYEASIFIIKKTEDRKSAIEDPVQ